MPDFSHLHVHTQFSLLDGAAPIGNLIKTAKEHGSKAIAITDHGNMFGVPKFATEAQKQGITPIIGCEFYIAHDRHDRKDQTRFHQVLLAKNEIGYKNLSKLSSAGYLEGMYYKPRIDKELIRQHKEGLIATTCCLASEVNRTIIRKGEKEGEEVFKEWLEIFGEDYYIELQRHGIAEQNTCNEVLLKWAKKYNVKVIATNDVHYVEQKDSEAQDILLCLQTGKDFDDPKRMRFENDQFYLKSPDEMAELFKDVPEALDNTNEIIDKVEPPKLKRDILMPIYILPEGFTSENEYLKHLTFEGAKKKYAELTDVVIQRLNFELDVIHKMGFPGYFLIVQDFIAEAKRLGVSVGPGRGSAAGSAVAYCTGITNIDPIKYNLLFERFLNPERVSMPDIDIDFDDAGRQKVIDYVVDKYGKNKVAQIITFGTMAAKSSIRDVARVLRLPLPEADRLAKLVPEGVGVNLQRAFKEVKELAEAKNSKEILVNKTLSFAEVLEGSARHTGIHAAGVIIAPDDLRELIPVYSSKDTDLYITQYDGKYIESFGMLKMDFLGLKTLTIIEEARAMIKTNHGNDIDIENIPLDDAKTFELYQKGETIGTFQFESDGMRSYLRELKPTSLEDLIAMNALYRPGPMDYIPRYISCKHGRQKVEYPHPMLEDMLKPTYGIMVYQEQVMQAVQIMGGFSLGKADLMRRAMGKKQADEMERQKQVFIEGAKEKGVDSKTAEEVFSAIAKFAEYGFNRSHSAAYSLLAYQTAYLKANYPAEYMAAVLTNNMSDIKKVAFFMEECRHMGISVLGPDVNESHYKFWVNKKGEIRFGLGAVKGVGESAANSIIEERKNGPFKDIFDLTSRINLRAANKRCLESLAQAGAFDCFKGVHRKQYLLVDADGLTGIDKAIKFGSSHQEDSNSNQASLFGELAPIEIPKPSFADCEPLNRLEQLKMERDIIGMYISGHPLDDFKLEIKHFCTHTLEELSDINSLKKKELRIAGMVVDAEHRMTKNGKPFGTITLEDYTATHQLFLFSDDYVKFKNFIDKSNIQFVFIKGKVQSRFRSETEFEFKVFSIDLLADVIDKQVKGIQLDMKLNSINTDLINSISKVFEKPGKGTLKFRIIDSDDNIQIDLPSQTKKITVNKELISEIDKLEGVRYSFQ
jgi:DNA polymerase III subunit alpha